MNPEPSAPARSPDWWLFFTKFLRQGTAIAAFAPSSRFLARAVVQGLDFRRARCVVELGAGTGPITAELVSRATPDCQLIVIEREADFCERLRRRFPSADVVQADVADLDRLLTARGVKQVDHFISGLPLPSFPPALREELLRAAAKWLSPDGTFRQLTHMPWVYYGLYSGYFADVGFRLVPLNLPPGGVYVCQGWRPRQSA
jgi:phospholipid N-methyltransferase